MPTWEMESSTGNRQAERFPVILLLFILSIIPILNTGCVTLRDPESSQEFRAHVAGIVEPEHTIGQSFISRRSRLNGIELWMQVSEKLTDKGYLQLFLFNGHQNSDPVYKTKISFSEIEENFPISVEFPPQYDPPGTEYFLKLQTNDGSIKVLGRQEDNYSNGYLTNNTLEANADLGFRLTYKYGFPAIIDDISEGISNAWFYLLLVAMLWIPGNLLIKILKVNEYRKLEFEKDLGVNIALSVGTSIALIPLLFLWARTFGFELNRTSTSIIFLLLFITNIWFSHQNIKKIFNKKQYRLSYSDWINIGLVSVFIFSLIIRMVMIRDLAAPAWVDSVHHALIARLIVQSGQLPHSYSPYLELSTANYHPGFHTNTAVFHFLSGLQIPRAILFLGQVLNALCIFASYLFAKTLLKNKLAGLIAAFITGFVTPMPAYYTSWGRYTQLTGILVFSAAIVLILVIFEREFSQQVNIPLLRRIRKNWRLLILAIILCAGLFLNHYRVSIFLASFFFVYFLVNFIQTIFDRKNPRELFQNLIILLFIAGSAFLLSSPWWPDTLKTFILPRMNMKGLRNPVFNDFQWRYLNAALGKFVTGTAFIGLIWGFIKKRKFTPIISLWIVFMFIIANIHKLPIPGAKLINNTSVEIFLFIPISTSSAYILAWLFENWMKIISIKYRRFYQYSLVFLFIFIAIIGTKSLLPLLNPVTFLLRQADYQAMEWIEANVSQDETILINPFAWGYGLYAGSDGGYWISPIAGRKTVPPPALYGLEFKTSGFKTTQNIIRDVIKLHNSPENLYPILLENNIRYIYIGKRGGILSPKLLSDSPYFEPIYSSEGTWVFKIHNPEI